MDDTLRQLAQMFAFGQGSHLMGENELPTSSLDEGKYLLREDPATHGYQLLRVLRFVETGTLKGASYDYPVGRRTYSGNDMAALLSLLCGSTVMTQAPKPVATKRFQDQTPPYLLPEEDPWSDTPHPVVWIQEATLDEVADPELPFRMVAEVQFASCGLSETYARQRVINALQDFFSRMEDYGNDSDLADDGSNAIGADLRSLHRWEDHPDYPTQD